MMVERSQQVLTEYVAGASLAFGVVVLVVEGLGAYYAWAGSGLETVSEEILLSLFAIIHILGGVFGGYLVCRRVEENVIRAGVITALLAYVIEFVYNLIFVGSFGGNLLALVSLVVGGFFGAMYSSHRHRRNQVQAPSD